MTANDIKSLIEEGVQLEDVLPALIDLAEQRGDSRMQNSLIQQSARHRGNAREFREGTLERGRYDMVRAQVRNAVLSLIDDMARRGYFPAVLPGLAALVQPAAPVAPAPAPVAVVEEPPAPTKVLFLTANPSQTAKVQLDKEHSRIAQKLEGYFPLRYRPAVSLAEFQEAILTERPTILHFSGHGELGQVAAPTHSGLDLDDEPAVATGGGIVVFEDEHRRRMLTVGPEVLRRMFVTAVQRRGIPMQAVVFNACYSEAQAAAVAQVVPYVVGVQDKVRDEAAIAFATGFYFDIAQGHGIADAVDAGVNLALAMGEPVERFVLFVRGERVAL